MNEFQEVICPGCKGYAKRVPVGTKLPKQPGSTMRDIWWCAGCRMYAELDRVTGKPTTGMGLPALHQKRLRVVASLKVKGMTTEGLRDAMGLKPWQFRPAFFTEAQCEEAIKIIQAYKPPEEFGLEEELLS